MNMNIAVIAHDGKKAEMVQFLMDHKVVLSQKKVTLFATGTTGEKAEKAGGEALPRQLMPKIDLKSPKITRKLTTEWFARRVEGRYRACLSRVETGA